MHNYLIKKNNEFKEDFIFQKQIILLLLILSPVPDGIDRFVVLGRGSHSLRLEWSVPKNINGILTGYILTYSGGV